MGRMTRSGRALLASAFMMACAATAQAQTPGNRILKVGVQSDLKVLDPIVTTSRVTGMFASSVYETLFAYDEDGVPQPQMVGDTKISDDKLTYEFKLRPDQRWHSGGPVTAADAVASLKRWMSFDPVGRMLNDFTKSLEAVDQDTFRLVLKEPYGLVLQSLAKPSPGSPFIMPERLAKTPISQPITEVDGSGPYIFKQDEWRPGNRVVFVKSPAYVPRKEPPSGLAGAHVVNFDRMEWLYIPDNNTGLSALQVGEIDYLDEVPFDFLPIIKSNKDTRLVSLYNGTLGFIRPNFTQPPFDKPLARQALYYLVDQPEFMNAAVGDADFYMKFCGSYFICGSENGTEAGSENFRGKDIAKAKKMLADSGYKGEPVVVLLATDRPLYAAWTQVMIQNLRDAGVNVDVKPSEWGALMSRWARKDPPEKGGWNLNIGAQPPGGTDPIKNPFFNPACDKAVLGWPCDEKLLKMIDAWSRETDDERRKAMIADINRQAYQSVPYVILGQYQQPVAVRANLTGVLKTGGTTAFWNMVKK